MFSRISFFVKLEFKSYCSLKAASLFSSASRDNGSAEMPEGFVLLTGSDGCWYGY